MPIRGDGDPVQPLSRLKKYSIPLQDPNNQQRSSASPAAPAASSSAASSSGVSARPKSVSQWSVVDVQKWFRKSCGEYYGLYAEKLLEQDITGRTLTGKALQEGPSAQLAWVESHFGCSIILYRVAHLLADWVGLT